MFGGYCKKQYLCTRKTETSSGENKTKDTVMHNG